MSGPTTRRRSLPFQPGRGTIVIKNTNGSQTTTSVSIDGLNGTQVTVSEGHPFNSRKGITGDLGGEFYTQKRYVASPSGNVKTFKHVDIFPGVWRETTYRGPAFPVKPSTVGFPPEQVSSNISLDAWGAKAVAACKPTNSVADASTFLGELYREGIPHMIGSQTWKARNRTARHAGHEYLNVEFGWKPLVNDISSFAKAVTHAHKVLAQYERDSGGIVRRKYHFPEKTVTEVATLATGAQAYGPSTTDAYSPPYGDLIRVRETTQKRWFSGAFTYHLPSGYDSRNKMIRYASRADQLLGITPTPETLWNLAPWSWAVDWFSSTGDVISNLTSWATDGLVMRYGYMMEHTIVKDTYTLTRSGLSGGANVPPLVLVTETKVRRRANPFGFGLTWSGLSPRQLAIAAALGLSKLG